MNFLYILQDLLNIPHMRTQLRLLRDLRSFTRIHYLSAALEAGILHSLKEQMTASELCSRLQIKRPQLLETFLDLGVALGDLQKDGPYYRIKNHDVDVLTRNDGDALAALIQEYASYHASVYQNLSQVLRGESLGSYLESYGTLIARSSRAFEPLIGGFVKRTIATHRPNNLLEVGCGSGIYLKYAHEGHPRLIGVAIDLNEDVVDYARRNLQHWGIDEHFHVLCADARALPVEVTRQSYDWISLYQNVYYFSPEERPNLFQQLSNLLAPGGVLAIVSLMRGHTPSVLDFDLILQSTSGCFPLPDLEQTEKELRSSNFKRVTRVRLMPGEPLFALLAYK